MKLELFKMKTAGFEGFHGTELTPHFTTELHKSENIYFYRGDVELHEFPFNLFYTRFTLDSEPVILLTLFKINKRRDGVGIWAGEARTPSWRFYTRLETKFRPYEGESELELYSLDVRVTDLRQ